MLYLSVLKDASSVAADVSDIVLVGGSTRIPRIQEMLIEHFEVGPALAAYALVLCTELA